MASLLPGASATSWVGTWFSTRRSAPPRSREAPRRMAPACREWISPRRAASATAGREPSPRWPPPVSTRIWGGAISPSMPWPWRWRLRGGDGSTILTGGRRCARPETPRAPSPEPGRGSHAYLERRALRRPAVPPPRCELPPRPRPRLRARAVSRALGAAAPRRARAGYGRVRAVAGSRPPPRVGSIPAVGLLISRHRGDPTALRGRPRAPLLGAREWHHRGCYRARAAVRALRPVASRGGALSPSARRGERTRRDGRSCRGP